MTPNRTGGSMTPNRNSGPMVLIMLTNESRKILKMQGKGQQRKPIDAPLDFVPARALPMYKGSLLRAQDKGGQLY
jgi:hypothetical protein